MRFADALLLLFLLVLLNSARRMKFAFCGQVRLVGNFWRRKGSKVDSSFINLDCCHVVVPVSANAQKSECARGTGRPSILHILSLRYISQIAKSVVAMVPVDVVDVFRRPLSIGVEPHKAMGKVQLPVNMNFDVPATISAACNVSNFCISRSAFQTDEMSGIWFVLKQFAQALCDKIGLSHDTVPSLIGQRPTRVESTCRLRHFNSVGTRCLA